MDVNAEHDVTGKKEHKGLGATLTQKIHGVPMWGIIGGGGLLFGIGLRYYKSTHSNATPAATDSSAATPSGSDGLTDADSGLPWSGGAPDGNAQYQNDIDTVQNASIVSNTAGLDALTQQESADAAAAQSSILTLAANAARDAAQFTASFAALAVPAGASVAPQVSAAPPPSAGVGNPVGTVPSTPAGTVDKASPSVVAAQTAAANKAGVKGKGGVNSHGIQ